MCRFKSGIIFKGRCVVASGENDSHSDLLESLGVEDSVQNAMTKFVRVELVPPNDEWWSDPDTWKAHVDQDIVPDWFQEDPDKYLAEFRGAVKAWWKVHVHVDEKIEELKDGYHRLKRCEVKRLLNDVKVLLDQSQVGAMRDSSQVSEMWESSQVGVMRDSSQVGVMRGSSQVGEMWESSTARDFKNYPKVKIVVPENTQCEFALEQHKNKEEQEDG